MKFSADIQDRSFEIEVKKENGKILVMVDNKPVNLKYETDQKGSISALIIEGKRYEVRCDDRTGNYKVNLWQKPYEVSFSRIETEGLKHISDLPPESGLLDKGSIRPAAQSNLPHRIIKSPMSGLVIAIHTDSGKEIKKGDSLILLEAMKMQNEIRSPITAKVLQVYAAVGKTVEKNEKLLELEPLS
jgi:biotin carboxyl carrier protein